jgi:hypothetical protein
MSLERLSTDIQARLREEFAWPVGVTTIALDFRPNEGYYWSPPAQEERYADALGVFAKTLDEIVNVLAKQNPAPPPTEVGFTLGKLRLMFFGPDRKLMMEVNDQGQATYHSR